MSLAIKINNPVGEALDVLVEGHESADTSVVFVHGFGTDKHETGGLFDDLAQALNKDFRTIRFDFSGYGQSEGQQEEGNYQKWATDLEAVLKWTQQEFLGNINILAQSMGCYITALLSPANIQKIVLQAIPNADMQVMKRRIQAHFGARGVHFNETGITEIIRSSGAVQKLGPSFWQVLDTLNPSQAFTELTRNSHLCIIHPQNDEIIGNEALELYQNLPHTTYLEIPGNHSFSDSQNRHRLIQEVQAFFNRSN